MLLRLVPLHLWRRPWLSREATPLMWLTASACMVFAQAAKGRRSTRTKRHSKTKHQFGSTRTRHRESWDLPAVSRPAAQISKNSYLGIALQGVRRTYLQEGSSSPPSSMSSKSSLSSSEDESGTSDDDYASNGHSSLQSNARGWACWSCIELSLSCHCRQ